MTILDRIFETKRQEIATAKNQVSQGQLFEKGATMPRLPFRQRLLDSSHRPSLIAEVKKASPSKGLIRPHFDALEVASSYQRAGADCLSVLTDVQYFQGSPAYLEQVKQEVRLPCLRKDFICDPYQIFEARAWGADCILLIASGLSSDQMTELSSVARELGMDVLFEVHDEAEIESILPSRPNFVGINNRNLKTFETTVQTTVRLAPLILDALPDATLVSESALENSSDIELVSRAGARTVLIGTRFCREPDVETAVGKVMGW